MSFASGAATFNSCNKYGAIDKFTNHLRNHPNDYNTLMWRARAYDIIGQPENARQDIEQAISVSKGVEREIAIAQQILATGDLEEYGAQAMRTLKKYRNNFKAYNELANFFAYLDEDEKAVQCYMESLNLATKNNETSDPDICWLNYKVGKSWMKKNDVDTAKRYFEAAIKSSPEHTVSHIELCKCNIAQGNISAARQNFQEAKSLNPNLASEMFLTDSFDEYVSRTGPQYTSVSSSATGIQGGGAERGPGGGNNDGGNDSGNNGFKDSCNKYASATWKRLQKEALKRYNSHTYL